jgi:hypothetical protein
MAGEWLGEDDVFAMTLRDFPGSKRRPIIAQGDRGAGRDTEQLNNEKQTLEREVQRAEISGQCQADKCGTFRRGQIAVRFGFAGERHGGKRHPEGKTVRRYGTS